MYAHVHTVLITLHHLHNNIIGNHTFAAIRGTESYSLLASLTDIISEINSLLKEPLLNGKRLRVVFGGDYKVRVNFYYNIIALPIFFSFFFYPWV